MLFIVTLNYRAAQADIAAQLPAHRDWLARHVAAGRFVVAGPLEPRTGGLILAHCEDRAELDALLADDPFVTFGLVDVAVLVAAPALRHADFPPRWALEAQALTTPL
ncbi:YciI family protein [Roseateles sp.]|uniref:YciI family protein n=1 Tax=Roseateles sp. TaxID=1971397 RepID=UPI0031E15132